MAKGIFVLARFGLFEDAGLFLARGFFAVGKLFMEGSYALHTGSCGIGGGPLAEEDGAFLLYLGIGDGV